MDNNSLFLFPSSKSSKGASSFQFTMQAPHGFEQSNTLQENHQATRGIERQASDDLYTMNQGRPMDPDFSDSRPPLSHETCSDPLPQLEPTESQQPSRPSQSWSAPRNSRFDQHGHPHMTQNDVNAMHAEELSTLLGELDSHPTSAHKRRSRWADLFDHRHSQTHLSSESTPRQTRPALDRSTSDSVIDPDSRIHVEKDKQKFMNYLSRAENHGNVGEKPPPFFPFPFNQTQNNFYILPGIAHPPREDVDGIDWRKEYFKSTGRADTRGMGQLHSAMESRSLLGPARPALHARHVSFADAFYHRRERGSSTTFGTRSTAESIRRRSSGLFSARHERGSMSTAYSGNSFSGPTLASVHEMQDVASSYVGRSPANAIPGDFYSTFDTSTPNSYFDSDTAIPTHLNPSFSNANDSHPRQNTQPKRAYRPTNMRLREEGLIPNEQNPNTSYEGDTQTNGRVGLPDHVNCVLWITGIPADTPIEEFIRAIETGAIVAVHMNEPDDLHPTQGAKVIYKRATAAQKLYQRARKAPFVGVRGQRINVWYNKYGRLDWVGAQTRYLEIEAPSAYDPRYWDGVFDRWCVKTLVSVQKQPCAKEGFSRYRYEFARVEQSQCCLQAIQSMHAEWHDQVEISYGADYQDH